MEGIRVEPGIELELELGLVMVLAFRWRHSAMVRCLISPRPVVQALQVAKPLGQACE